MEKLSPNRAQLFLLNKYTVFTIGGTVALRSVNKKIPESYSSAARTHYIILRFRTTVQTCTKKGGTVLTYMNGVCKEAAGLGRGRQTSPWLGLKEA